MATLYYENSPETTDLEVIQKELAPLGVTLSKWAIPQNEGTQLLSKESLSEDEKKAALKGLDVYFEKLKEESGYVSRDMIAVSSSTPNLDAMLEKFVPAHTHDDDEVRYIVDGEGIFGFVRPDGSQVELKVEKEDYINVPKDTEHWFRLTSSKRIKAVRYFTGMDGWSPKYTGTEVRIK